MEKEQDCREELALLTTVVGNEEIALLEGVLAGEGILFVRQARKGGGAVQLYTGGAPEGVEFYVEQSKLAQAQEVMAAYYQGGEILWEDTAQEGDTDAEEIKEEQETNQAPTKAAREGMALLLAALTLGAVLWYLLRG